MMITQGNISAEYPVLADEKFGTCESGGSITMNRLNLTTTGNVCIQSDGIGVVTVEECTLNATGGTGILMKGGRFSATKVAFKNATLAIQCDQAVTLAKATNCMTKSTLPPRVKSKPYGIAN